MGMLSGITSFLADQESLSATIRAIALIVIAALALALWAVSRRLPLLISALLLLIPVLLGAIVSQWTYPVLIQNVEEAFRGNWMIGGKHHANTPAAVHIAVGMVAIVETACYLGFFTTGLKIGGLFFMRIGVIGLPHLLRHDWLLATLMIIAIWLVKLGVYILLKANGIQAFPIPPPINNTGWVGVYSVTYSAFWGFLLYCGSRLAGEAREGGFR